MPDGHQISRAMVEAAATSLANARAMRRGAPTVTNVLRFIPAPLRAELLEDAEEALKAGLAARESWRG